MSAPFVPVGLFRTRMASEDEKDEKKALYRRIVQKASDDTIARRMREHGFWPKGEPVPQDPPAETAERAKLESELDSLRTAHSTTEDPEKALHEERQRRWEESKKKRAEKKAQRLAALKERREKWAAEKKSRTVFLGEGVSAGLDGPVAQTSDVTKLAALGLPVLNTSNDLAAALKIELKTLKWLTFHRRGATLVHYRRYSVPKKTGGVRHISAPGPKLAAAQEWILRNILDPVEKSPEAHGFVAGRSIVTNAKLHVGKKIVVNLDAKDFFPTFDFRRVKGLFARRLGYSEHVATVLALLCTEPPRVEATVDGKKYWVALGDRRLPQGACTSPALTKLICARLDRRLAGLARAWGFTYTRYADDLTFSGDDGEKIGDLLHAARRILGHESVEENEQKTRIMRRGRRQEVTGVTVNAKLAVSREKVRELRAILHNCAKKGFESQNHDGHEHFRAHLGGWVSYVQMVDPIQGERLRAALTKALAAAGPE